MAHWWPPKNCLQLPSEKLIEACRTVTPVEDLMSQWTCIVSTWLWLWRGWRWTQKLGLWIKNDQRCVPWVPQLWAMTAIWLKSIKKIQKVTSRNIPKSCRVLGVKTSSFGVNNSGTTLARNDPFSANPKLLVARKEVVTSETSLQAASFQRLKSSVFHGTYDTLWLCQT